MRLIDADALMKAIKNFRWFGVPNTLKLMFDYLKIIIRDQPTIEAAPVVHGEWHDAKFVRAYKGTNLPVVQCSKCECYFCDVINNHHFMYHYCPNCGARMDGDSKAPTTNHRVCKHCNTAVIGLEEYAECPECGHPFEEVAI